MKRRKKAIRRARKAGAREWSLKVAPTYLAIIADKDERITELTHEWQSLQNENLRVCHERDAALTEAERCRRNADGWRERAQAAEKRVAQLNAGCIACPSLSEAQMLAKGLESDVERLTAILAAEKEQLAAAGDELRDVRAELVAVAEDRDRLQQAHDAAQQEVRELAVHLHAADAERDRLRHGERERLNVGTGMLRACNEKLEAQVVQLTAERNYYIDCLNTERREWQGTITQEQSSTRAGWDRANELREQRQSLRERVEELQAENARLHDQLTNYSVVSEHTEQSLRDAKLGRLVRAMPGGLELYRTERGTPWRTAYLGDREPRFGETPEEALEAAGVTIPPAPNADAGLWRYAEERRASASTGADVVAGSGEDGY